MTHSRSDLVAWHRRCVRDYLDRSLRDEHGHGAAYREFAERHAATARLLERDGKRWEWTKPKSRTMA